MAGEADEMRGMLIIAATRQRQIEVDASRRSTIRTRSTIWSI